MFAQPTIPEFPLGKASLQGQTAIITGATSGIGHELGFQLLRLGLSHLIIGVRSLQRGAAARLSLLADEEVQKVNSSARVTVLELDLARYESVVSFAHKILDLPEKRLDLLVLNAGINLAEYQETPDGNEACMQVNLLSNSFLSLLLLPLIQKTSATYYQAAAETVQRPTITWLGSMGHAFHSPDLAQLLPSNASILDYFSSRDTYSRFRRYSDTKLFVILFVRELADRIAASSSSSKEGAGVVVVNNVCPGTVATGADNNLPFYVRIPMNLNRAARGRSVPDGARAVLWAARGNLQKPGSAAGWNGVYIADGKIQEPTPFANSPEGREFAKKLWAEIVSQGRKLDGRIGEGLGN
ncbi:short-chain dehydrogenase/reductase family protein [Apiospora marii]|uniref:short-chain dehydrogenase/reductase family protein n=1 Tax=Apiospora marii TaxID=335849 RepID=UPI00312E36BB